MYPINSGSWGQVIAGVRQTKRELRAAAHYRLASVKLGLTGEVFHQFNEFMSFLSCFPHFVADDLC